MNAHTEIKRGQMTDDERAEIDRLVETLRRPTPRAVADRINRHPGTVFWYMLNRGYLEGSKLTYRLQPYMRYGKMVYPYTAKEDARLLKLRTEGGTTRSIANALSAEFEKPRTPHSVEIRLKFLASYEDGGTQ